MKNLRAVKVVVGMSDGPFDRRKFLASIGALTAAGALAGCVEEDDDPANQTAGSESTIRPQPSGSIDDLTNFNRYVAEMLEYQTNLLEEIHEEVT